ncbi:hypothetical protein C2845_PM06G18960 [Panicum miliaceum]|uniref:Uncharacterized protein n=1 Tax=Panicum miliaceum TaxID=4540 RepID=A0A3L6R8S4_PANMI|nr:hypothetical protein C2845_PM06G18960 [Panicum miliaceum]
MQAALTGFADFTLRFYVSASGSGTCSHGADLKGEDKSTTVECDPWNPELPPPPPAIYEAANLEVQLKMIFEYEAQNDKILSESRARSIITPDHTPQVALEGKAPKLRGNGANPNYMNSFGSFPLHQAASMFSVDMINLLIDYGASANLRTAGNKVIEGLLPLHVAIEDTCMHKYLEDNLLTDQKHLEHSNMHVDYIYKLIHLLCLPEMKMFLDTIRRLAKDTDNVVDELWKYIEDGKLVHVFLNPLLP